MKKSFVLGLVLIVILATAVSAKALLPTPVYGCQTLNKTGTYILMNDITTDKTCFSITTDKIILNLNNHTISGKNKSPFSGIIINQTKNVTIYNGQINNFYLGIEVVNSDKVTIKNNKLNYGSVYAGIVLSNTTRSLLENNIIKFSSDGIVLNKGSSYNIIRGGLISNNSESGVLFTSAYYNQLKDIAIQYNSENDFSFEANNPDQCYQTISNVTWTPSQPTLFYNSTISLHDLSVGGLILCGADNSNLTNITINNKIRMNKLTVDWTNNSTFSNIFINNSDGGLQLWHSSHNKIDKLVSSNNHRDGIDGGYSDYNNISSSILENNQRWGLHLSDAKYTVLSDLYIINSTRGIDLIDGGYNLIKNNHIIDNTEVGLLVSQYEDEESYPNLFYNNFFNNTLNTKGSMLNNLWSITKAPGKNIVGGSFIGGNYWAQPDGSGYSENCADADNDGFCDKFYMVSEGNIDYLPLTN